MSIIGLIYFIVVLGLIVLVHELGHLVVAKRNNVFCHEFSIGMGPKIKTIYKDKKGTIYNLRAIPIGGYVHMAGEDTGLKEDEDIPEDLKFDKKTKWIKFKILVAGATMNFILGIFIFIIVGFFGGTPDLNTNEVTVVQYGVAQNDSQYEMPLYKAGIRTGDKILSINNEEVTNFDTIVNLLQGEEETFILKYYDTSAQKEVSTSIQKDKDGHVGISPYTEKYKFFKSIKYGFTQFVNVGKDIFVSFQLLFTPEYSIKDLSGPIGIAVASNGVLYMGWIAALSWIAFLSINIGIINLLPIPALDGGRILFLVIELIIGKPINRKLETTLNNIVFIALLVLLVFVTFNDILNIQKLLDLFN